MSKFYIYLVSGKSQAGKDTLYDLCKNEVGWKQVSFAEKLKDTVADLYGFTFHQMYGDLKDIEDKRYPNLFDPQEIKKYPEGLLHSYVATENNAIVVPNPDYREFLTPRRILQIFGQQQRALDPDIWARYVFKTTIPTLREQGYNKFIITDARFKNEIKVAEKYTDSDTTLVKVRIHRPDVFAKSGANDISEIDLDDYKDWNHIIRNDGSFEALMSKGLSMVYEVEK